MTYKSCRFCSTCLRNHPTEIALTIYEPERDRCPRCGEREFEIVETDVKPVYAGVKSERKLF